MGAMDLEIKTYLQENMQKLQELLRIPSVYDAATADEKMPYGKGVAAALEYMRQLAVHDGFEVLEYDGHAIAIQLPGAEGERIDIVSHLDVVEAGDGWKTDPFGGEIRDGRLYGRGAQDMKTSAFLTYLALRRLREEGVRFRRRLRIVFGCDEERTMDDMAYYVARAGMPAFAFTPDGRFPMAIGEKGALMWRLSGHYEGMIEEMDCGVQCNVISPQACAVLRGKKPLPEGRTERGGQETEPGEADAGISAGIFETLRRSIAESGIEGTVERNGETLIVRTGGRAAHASRPEEGHSATVDLFYLLGKVDPLMENLYEAFADPYGGRLGIPFSADEQTQFTMNPGIFRIKNGECYGEVDGRYPFGLTSAECTKRLAERLSLAVSLDYDSPPTMNDAEDVYVAALLSAYRDCTGDLSAPVISGGVSYSKIFGHCVAFGPILPGAETLCHQADENIAIADCEKAFEIYLEAMRRLALL